VNRDPLSRSAKTKLKEPLEKTFASIGSGEYGGFKLGGSDKCV
jgi:hypothetical protein